MIALAFEWIHIFFCCKLSPKHHWYTKPRMKKCKLKSGIFFVEISIREGSRMNFMKTWVIEEVFIHFPYELSHNHYYDAKPLMKKSALKTDIYSLKKDNFFWNFCIDNLIHFIKSNELVKIWNESDEIFIRAVMESCTSCKSYVLTYR